MQDEGLKNLLISIFFGMLILLVFDFCLIYLIRTFFPNLLHREDTLTAVQRAFILFVVFIICFLVTFLTLEIRLSILLSLVTASICSFISFYFMLYSLGNFILEQDSDN